MLVSLLITGLTESRGRKFQSSEAFPDGLTSAMGIDGHWTGHYYQDEFDPASSEGDHDRNVFPIEAWFETSGLDLTGRMTDLRPVQEVLYSEWVAIHFESFSRIEQREAKEYIADHPACSYRASLFPESTLEGRFEADQVSFTKTYTGPCEFA